MLFFLIDKYYVVNFKDNKITFVKILSKSKFD